jgi:hypothetical protein
MGDNGSSDSSKSPRERALYAGTIESAGSFTDVSAGDVVYREFYGQITPLSVTRVDDELIYTDDEGTYDRRTGWETDLELGIGWRFGVTVSRLIRPVDTPQASP